MDVSKLKPDEREFWEACREADTRSLSIMVLVAATALMERSNSQTLHLQHTEMPLSALVGRDRLARFVDKAHDALKSFARESNTETV